MTMIQSVCTSFKSELLRGQHDLTSDILKLALYDDSANLDSTITAYSTSGEISTPGYVAGGSILVASISTSGTTVSLDFQDVTWSDPSFSATIRGGLIYNSSVAGNPAIAVIDFGLSITKTTSVTVNFPIPGSNTSMIRVV